MMNETLLLLRYACKLGVITQPDIERMLQALGTPHPESKPPTLQLVENGLLSEDLLDSLWSEAALRSSLESGVLKPGQAETLRLLRDVHANPDRLADLTQPPRWRAPGDDDEPSSVVISGGVAGRAGAGRRKPPPVPSEEPSTLGEIPPLEAGASGEEATLDQDDPDADESGEVIFGGEDSSDQATICEDALPPATPDALRDAPTVFEGPPGDEMDLAPTAYEEPERPTLSEEMAPMSERSIPAPGGKKRPEPSSTETGSIEFEPDPTLSHMRLGKARPPSSPGTVTAQLAPEPLTAQLAAEPLTAVLLSPPAGRGLKVAVFLLLLACAGLGLRLAWVETRRPQTPEAPARPPIGPSTALLRLTEEQLSPLAAAHPQQAQWLWTQMLRWFQQSIERSGRPAEGRIRLGQHLLVAWGAYDQAAAALRESKSTLPHVLWARAWAHDRLAERKKRDELLAQLAGLAETEYHAQVARAEQARVAGKPEAALQTYDRLAAQQPLDPFAALQQIRLLRRLGQADRARLAVEALVKSRPVFLAARVEEAAAQADRGDLAAADAGLKRLERQDLFDPVLQLVTAVLRRKQGKPEESLRIIDNELALPEMAEAHWERARALAALGREAEAKAAAAEAAKLDPSLKR